MSKIITIYCEGIEGSHDKNIIEKVIAGLSSSCHINLNPIRGIKGAKAIIQYIEDPNSKLEGAIQSDFKILFRDRDFDKPIPPNVILELDKEGGYCYFSYRNTIENYLFDTSIFFYFLQQKSLCEKYHLYSEDDVKKTFIGAAEKIKYYQAIRHTMGKMRTGETNFGTKLTEESGKLPKRLDEEFCKCEAWSKIEKAKSFADSWNKENFLEIYQTFIDLFSKDFMEALDFLIYFQGKDFASSLNSILPNFPLKDYYRLAKQHFDYHKFQDLVQLRELIERQV